MLAVKGRTCATSTGARSYNAQHGRRCCWPDGTRGPPPLRPSTSTALCAGSGDWSAVPQRPGLLRPGGARAVHHHRPGRAGPTAMVDQQHGAARQLLRRLPRRSRPRDRPAVCGRQQPDCGRRRTCDLPRGPVHVRTTRPGPGVFALRWSAGVLHRNGVARPTSRVGLRGRPLPARRPCQQHRLSHPGTPRGPLASRPP